MMQEYTLPQMRQTVAALKKVFDLVRVVNPAESIECDLVNSTETDWQNHPYMCYSVWAKNGRCDNCISMRALLDNTRKTKFEFINNDIYYVVAVPVKVEGKRFSLEIVSDMSDDVLLGAFGHNEFVDKITKYNTRRYHDPLTGVYNRRYLSEKLFPEGESLPSKMAVAVIDVDNFTVINELYSQLVGDELLVRLSKYLSNIINSDDGDCVVRAGGDEFMAIFRSIDAARFTEKTERLREAVEAARFSASEDIRATLSIGTATSEELPGGNLERLVAKADERLFAAKVNGGNMIVME